MARGDVRPERAHPNPKSGETSFASKRDRSSTARAVPASARGDGRVGSRSPCLRARFGHDLPVQDGGLRAWGGAQDQGGRGRMRRRLRTSRLVPNPEQSQLGRDRSARRLGPRCGHTGARRIRSLRRGGGRSGRRALRILRARAGGGDRTRSCADRVARARSARIRWKGDVDRRVVFRAATWREEYAREENEEEGGSRKHSDEHTRNPAPVTGHDNDDAAAHQ